MALNNLTVYLKGPENRGSTLPFDGIIQYTRNEEGRNIIKLYVIPEPNDASIAGESIQIRLMKARRKRDEEVTQARVDYTFTGAVDVRGKLFEWDLQQIVFSAAKPFPIVRRGRYFFEVEFTGPLGKTVVTSDDFDVCLLTTDRFEQEWLLGVTRRANDDRSVRFQPSVITGVKVVEVSKNHPLDMFPLRLVKDGQASNNSYFLSWRNGEMVQLDTKIPSGIDKQYILLSNDRKHYIVVQVDPFQLPQNDTSTEYLMVDKELISRESLRRWIEEEAQWLESNYLFVPLDPALVVSDFNLSTLSVGSGANAGTFLPDNSDYDLKGAPATYYPPEPGHWISLKVPYWRILHFDYLVGALENTRIVDVNVDWIHRGSTGYIDLIPFNQSLAYHFIGLMYVHALRGPTNLPSFWRYRYYAGIEYPQTPLPIIECIGLRAAVKALAVLGQMYRGGFSSQSISRGGVSESVSYTSSATFGVYSATIEEYKKRLEPLLLQLKRTYYGIPLEAL